MKFLFAKSTSAILRFVMLVLLVALAHLLTDWSSAHAETNVALNKTATASSVLVDSDDTNDDQLLYGPQNAVDGTIDNVWATDDLPASVTVDLSGPHSIERWEMICVYNDTFGSYAAHCQDVVLESSPDGSQYTEIDRVIGHTAQDPVGYTTTISRTLSSPATGRYLEQPLRKAAWIISRA